jgi:hypothetical protein
VTDHVKPGQVWQHKALGSMWVVGATWDQTTKGSVSRWWGLKGLTSDKTKSVPEWVLFEDYVLVKEAP